MTIVLVTGANGQLGLCIKDLEDQYPDLKFIYTDYEDLDISDLNQVKSFFSEKGIEYCINCAAYTAVDKAETEKELAFKINAEGPKNLADACFENNAKLVHISTDFVFDGERTEPYTELDTPNPISVYGISKLKGEIEVQRRLKEHFIIRTSWLYSEYGNNFMKTMLRLAEIKNEISVVNDQIGTPTYAGDLAELVVNVIRNKSDEFGLYHYSNEGAISWYDFAKAIFKEINFKIKVYPIDTESYPTSAKRPAYSVMDKLKIKNTFPIIIFPWENRLKEALLKFFYQKRS